MLFILLAGLAASADPAIGDEAPIVISESIIVTGRLTTPQSASFETRHTLSPQDVAAASASSVDELIGLLPSTHLPVNSRGESIVFVRNAGERQAAVFYDGAAINVPWDNRLDLSLLPAGLIESARLAAGPLAPHYGVNALGAVAFESRDPARGGRARIAFGNGGYGAGEAFAPLVVQESFAFALGGGYSSRDGLPLSAKADVPFSQPDPDLRVNTDRKLAHVFGKARLDTGGHRFRLTALHVTGEKGVAPESDRPDGARFWRYPDVYHTLVILNADSPLGARTNLDGTVWLQDFGQTIDAYETVAYETIERREIDRDRTYGVRQILSHESGPAKFVGSLSFVDAEHRQRDLSFENGAAPLPEPDALVFRQRNLSVGGEFEYQLTDRLIAEVGAGYDRVGYVRTGDKPPIDAASGWTGRAGLVFDAGNGWRLRAAAGRKLRAPTMRELFGQALNRFLINPDLRPERIVSAELAAEWRGDDAGFFVIPFYQDLNGTIDQRRVGDLRQRINLDGSRIAGVEFGGDAALTPELRLSGAATYANVRRKGAAQGAVEGESDRIAEKPALLARAMADYSHPSGLGAALEVTHIGRAYSANEAGDLVLLKTSTSVNVRLTYTFAAFAGEGVLFAHFDNLTDAFIEPQLGLPAPGRTIRGGVRVDW